MQLTKNRILKPARTDCITARIPSSETGIIRAFRSAEVPRFLNPKVRINEALIELRNGRRSQRIQAARDLGDIACVHSMQIPEAVVPLSVTLISDRDPHVRQEAAWSLWKLGDARGHEPLLQALLDDPVPAVREKVARALGLMGVRRGLPLMKDLLTLERHVPARVRAGIACAFGYLAEESLFEDLIKAAADPEPLVRYEAVRSIGRFLVGFDGPTSERAFKLLKRYLKPRSESCGMIRQAAVKALRFSSGADANRAVADAATSDPDSTTREAANEALVLWDSADSEAALIVSLSDDVWQVRKAAVRSLSRFIMRFGVYDSAAACEALRRMERMMPSHSIEWRLAADAFASL